MKRFIIFVFCQLLIFISPFSQALAQEPPADSARVEKTYDEGIKDGRQYAIENYKARNWFWRGFAGGVCGVIYAPVVIGVSQIGKPRLPPQAQSLLQNESPAYHDGFQKGYARRAKSKALGRSLLGSAVGAVTLLGLGTLVWYAVGKAWEKDSGALG